ncbi:MAG: DUF222 domain-containing protein [Acidimicrobiaceae bacterium]|nr:DUF222 domain-containing protein [Acidimicrobiaceae bacterium]MYK73018.1 DUF222 domain-containing protein [Acidimicrobiaceae bacterium]
MLVNVTGSWHTVPMLIAAARRAETAAKETLALIDEGAASCEETREALAVLRSAAAAISAAQTAGAASVAARERHGDGGTEMLAAAAGLSRREAQGQVKTAATLHRVPVLREALESGRVPQANARQLAAAVEKAGAGAVASDRGLLEAAEAMRPEQFAKEARRWSVDRQGDDGAGEHARQRARRRLRVWDGDDGMVHLHGEFDKVAGTRIANRLRRQARCLCDADRKAVDAERRSFDQGMADALDELTARGETRGAGETGGGEAGGADVTGDASNGAGSRPSADICVMVHADEETGRLVAELPDRTRLPRPVLDALSCDAAITGVICDRQGSPIWRSYASRGATETQRQILFATYGGCFHCGTNPGVCQIHHIEPVWLGGKTEINNLLPLCYRCHNLIHEHGWWILKRTLGHHTMHPPDGPRHGPAHQSDHPVLYRTGLPADGGHSAPAPADPSPCSPRHRRGPPSNPGSPVDDDGRNPGSPVDDNGRREPALF